MPTPESEAFKAKKPTVPPTFDGVDFRNNQQVWDARDAIIREQWVKQMMARLVRDELGKCYVREGVNHLQNCGKYRDRYLQLLKENREKGYRGQQENYIPGVTGPELGGATGRPDVPGYYPTVQQAMGEQGTDKRKGATIGAGKEIY